MTLLTRLHRESLKSNCRYNIAAAALDFRGRVLALAFNKVRLRKTGGGLHAEVNVLRKAGPSVARVVLLRTGKGGDIRPIHPCKSCSKLLTKLEVKLEVIHHVFRS